MTSASSGLTSFTVQYDALGRRIKRTQGIGYQKYSYDGMDVVIDDNNGTLTKYQNGPGIDNKLKQTTSGTSKYFLQDHLGSTVALTNSSGVVTESQSYDSFGNRTNTSFSSRYQYTGREFDSTTGLQYSRARWYDPNIGRFISEDPIGFGGGINEYSYVSNNPVNATDPMGLYEIDVHYYLTLYLALRSGCFSQGQAVAIANADQMTDEEGETAPGPGLSSQNANYHALNSGAYPGQWGPGLSSPPISPVNFKRFGQSLHYYQDSFSHAGYTNPYFGHLTGGHGVDKTISDPAKAMRMARGTFAALVQFGGQLGCKCNESMSSDTEFTVQRFLHLPGAEFPNLFTIDDYNTPRWQYLDPKVRSLGLQRR